MAQRCGFHLSGGYLLQNADLYMRQVDLLLVKQDARSWNTLEQKDIDIGHITFGVSGRTGTIGGKAPVLDEGNKLRTGT